MNPLKMTTAVQKFYRIFKNHSPITVLNEKRVLNFLDNKFLLEIYLNYLTHLLKSSKPESLSDHTELFTFGVQLGTYIIREEQNAITV